ncbi:MAG: transporter substrate-binding domain-containing protein [Halospina sp.]
MLLITPAWAKDEGQRPVLKGAYIEFPPLTYTSEQGKPTGPYMEAANRLAREAGYEIEWRSLPIDRIYLYLRKGKLDLWLGSQGVPALSDSTLEPDFSFREIRLQAYHLRETDPVSSIRDLRGRHLILIRGYTYMDRLDPIMEAEETRVDQASTHPAALRMLKAGRGDYLLDFEAPVAQALERLSLPEITHSPITTWGTTLVFSQETDDVEGIIRDFEGAWSEEAHSLRR